MFIQAGRLTEAKILIDMGADVAACDKTGQTPSHYCARKGQVRNGYYCYYSKPILTLTLTLIFILILTLTLTLILILIL